MKELIFSSSNMALQYLADLTNKKIKIAIDDKAKYKAIFSIDGKKINLERVSNFVLGEVLEDNVVKNLTWKEFKQSRAPIKEQKSIQKDFIKALLKQEKQFNKKVDFNSFIKKNNPSFEEQVDWLLKNTKAKYTKKGIKA